MENEFDKKLENTILEMNETDSNIPHSTFVENRKDSRFVDMFDIIFTDKENSHERR